MTTVRADDHLQIVKDIIADRGKRHGDGPEERSMNHIVTIFNAMTGLSLTEEQGWKFMVALKLGRMRNGKFHLDNFHDAIGYMSLLTECEADRQIEKSKRMTATEVLRRWNGLVCASCNAPEGEMHHDWCQIMKANLSPPHLPNSCCPCSNCANYFR